LKGVKARARQGRERSPDRGTAAAFPRSGSARQSGIAPGNAALARGSAGQRARGCPLPPAQKLGVALRRKSERAVCARILLRKARAAPEPNAEPRLAAAGAAQPGVAGEEDVRTLTLS